jgi:hypothetical protein
MIMHLIANLIATIRTNLLALAAVLDAIRSIAS